MEGDTLLDSDSGSFDSLTFLPAGSNLEERPSKKRSFDNLSNTSTTLPSTSSLQRASAQKDKKKRKVSFMISDDDEGKKEVAGKPNHDEGDIKLSKEEIEEMKRKTEHWWSLPDGTTQEEFDHAFDHFKDGRYFQTHMEIEWMDVQIQRACGRLLSQDQFSDPVQQLCAAIHAAMTHNDAERVAKLVQEDPELTQLMEQYKASHVDMLVERQRLTDKFGMIHSAKIAIKSEVYVCSATRLKQAGKEVTDEAVEEELAAFERGVNTVPGSQPQGGCIMAQGYRGPPMDVSGMGTCPVRHDGQQQSLPQSPQTAAAHPPPAGVCPFTGRRAPTSGGEPSQKQQQTRVEESMSALPAPSGARGTTSVCPYTGHKAPTCGDEGVQPPEEDDGVGE